ncbi:transposon-encoded TnpW family protein [Butyrivibrio sp. AE3004]|uniref:transposon-encoded TnpW family protein n=1 Tax=Butyrivibrio sp. AE3004 TaxID=1506994 RepID=UPI0009E0672F
MLYHRLCRQVYRVDLLQTIQDEKSGGCIHEWDHTCASSLPTSTISRTIGKTTYSANLHFKEQGQTFSQKLKRVLKADCA